jgi:hypothetical protein
VNAVALSSVLQAVASSVTDNVCVDDRGWVGDVLSVVNNVATCVVIAIVDRLWPSKSLEVTGRSCGR